MRHTTDFIQLEKEMHHCSSLAKHEKGYILTFYHGQECTDKQRVAVCFAKEPGKVLSHIDLENKTGNSIVWNYKGKVYLIHSIFSDVTADGIAIDYGSAIVKRWMNCDNFLSEVVVENDEVKVINTAKIDGAYGLLARCQPLAEDNRVIIPMYREENPICEAWQFVDGELSKLGEFGFVTDDVKDLMKTKNIEFGNLGKGVAIQPSIIKRDGLYHAVCRNVCRPNNSFAWICSSPDCKNWSGLRLTGIPNHNNSIISIQGETDILVFSSNGRSDMLLYNTTNKKHCPLHHATAIGARKPSYSYPNYLNDGERLHVVHTNCRIIAWHVFDKEFMQNFKQT